MDVRIFDYIKAIVSYTDVKANMTIEDDSVCLTADLQFGKLICKMHDIGYAEVIMDGIINGREFREIRIIHSEIPDRLAKKIFSHVTTVVRYYANMPSRHKSLDLNELPYLDNYNDGNKIELWSFVS